VTGSKSLAEDVPRSAEVFASRTATALSGPNPKVLLLLLCARIGYSPHACFQR
jgi:hypothetical protein